MLDYIWNRIHSLRKSNVIDFMTEYMRKQGEALENMKGNSEIPHTKCLHTNHYAKTEKNMESSRVKQTTYRNGEEHL